ncbi:MAG TPA: murein L,D-transpeptidase catalytic domain family protein [Catalimonadaceae bacterium]|nr:murein L,D-transpeptidase catalytic domain family protein [Catalimonadaceae bacterium]
MLAGLLWLSISLAFASGKPLTVSPDSIRILYQACGVENEIDFPLFKKSVEGFLRFKPKKSVIAIADLRRPSNEKRLFLIDLKNRKLLESTWVAHGRNSGMTKAIQYSNEPQSYQTSPGFYLVRNPIQSPKHGLALMLDGLEKGLNDNARKREIIIHGADYVSEDFIRKTGRCGRSHGCPAVPVDKMESMVKMLANGGLLYIQPSGKS